MPAAGGTGTSKKRGRTASAAPAPAGEEESKAGEAAYAEDKGKGKGKGTRPANNKRRQQAVQEEDEDESEDDDEGEAEVQDEDMDAAKPARKIAKVNAVAAAPAARVNKSSTSASASLMRTASGASSSGRNGTAAAAPMPNIVDDLLAGDASASPAARQAAAAHEVKRAEREVAKLRGQLETNLTAYQKLQEQFDELRDLRHTEAESRIEELTSSSNARAEASRQQVNAYAAETEELRQDVKRLKGEIDDLRAVALQQQEQEEGQAGQGGDESMAGSEPEEGAGEGDATTFVAETQFPDGHRRTGQAQGQSPAAKARRRSPSFTRADVEAPLHAQIAELQAENTDLRERLRDGEKQRRAQRKEADEVHKRALGDAEAKHRLEAEALREQVKDARAKAAQYEKELAFEMEQSRKKFQAAPPASTQSQSQLQLQSQAQAQAQLAAALPTAPLAAIQALTAPQHVLTLNTLLLDLIGLTLVSHRVTSTLGTVYDFLLTDFKKRKTLHFKFEKPASPSALTDPGAPEGMYTFTPEFMQGRDDAVKLCLDASLLNKIQFADPVLPSFFRRLYRSMNGL